MCIRDSVNADRHPAPFFRENLLSVPLTHIQEQITHLQHVLRRAGHAVAARTNSLGAEIPREMLHAKLAESAFKQQLQTGLARRLLHHRRNRVGVAAGILIMRTRFIRHRLGKERFQPACLQRAPLAAANHAAISAVHRNQIAQRHLLQIFTRIFRRKLGEHVNQPIIQAQISVQMCIRDRFRMFSVMTLRQCCPAASSSGDSPSSMRAVNAA